MYAKYSGGMYTHEAHKTHPPPHPLNFQNTFPLQRTVRLTKYSISCNWKIQHFAGSPPTEQHSYTVSVTSVTVNIH